LEIAAQGFRAIDEFECQSMSGTTAAEQCFLALDNPTAETFTVFADDRPVAMFGASPFSDMGADPGTCVLWFLGSSGLFKIKKDFMTQVGHWLDWLQRYYPTGFNYVSADNHVSLRWCKAVGFMIGPTSRQGNAGELFTFIYREGGTTQCAP
jgi:hypothetical protein